LLSSGYYYKRKEEGVCTLCGVNAPHIGQLKCDDCRVKSSKHKYTYDQHKEWQKQRVSRNPENEKKVSKRRFEKFYLTINGRATHLLNNARSRAKKQNIQCTLTQEWIKAKLDVGICEVTGIPFEYNVGQGIGHKTNSFSPSLDRISQKGDYTPENVRLTCWIYNRARGAFPDADFDRMLKAVAQIQK